LGLKAIDFPTKERCSFRVFTSQILTSYVYFRVLGSKTDTADGRSRSPGEKASWLILPLNPVMAPTTCRLLRSHNRTPPGFPQPTRSPNAVATRVLSELKAKADTQDGL